MWLYPEQGIIQNMLHHVGILEDLIKGTVDILFVAVMVDRCTYKILLFFAEQLQRVQNIPGHYGAFMGMIPWIHMCIRMDIMQHSRNNGKLAVFFALDGQQRACLRYAV